MKNCKAVLKVLIYNHYQLSEQFKLMQPTCKQSEALQQHLKLIRALDYPNYSQLSQLSPKGPERPPA